jgi:hypothetical protein
MTVAIIVGLVERVLGGGRGDPGFWKDLLPSCGRGDPTVQLPLVCETFPNIASRLAAAARSGFRKNNLPPRGAGVQAV